MMPSPKPDRFEKSVRFGCGALAGVVAGICAAVGSNWSIGELVGIVALVALVFGGCAMWFGDQFWLRVASWLSWW